MEDKTTPSITMHEVTSTQLAAIGHDPATSTLAVRFKGKGDKPGTLYHYANFPADRFLQFIEADKAGGAGVYFSENVKPAVLEFPYTRVE